MMKCSDYKGMLILYQVFIWNNAQTCIFTWHFVVQHIFIQGLGLWNYCIVIWFLYMGVPWIWVWLGVIVTYLLPVTLLWCLPEIIFCFHLGLLLLFFPPFRERKNERHQYLGKKTRARIKGVLVFSQASQNIVFVSSQCTLSYSPGLRVVNTLI